MKSSDTYVYVAGACVLVGSLLVRIISYPIVTSDYVYFVAKWFDTLATQPGFTAFHSSFSDYAPLYLYLIKLLTVIPVYSLYSTKTLSFLFDCAAAIYGALIAQRVTQKYSSSRTFLIASTIIAIPTLALNDSLWGQSDILYAAPVLASLYYLLVGALWPAAIAMGIALSFKLQAIFFLPVCIGLALRQRNGWWYIATVPAIYVLSLVPAWLGGGSFVDLLLTYVRQSGEYNGLSLWAPSIFAFTDTVPLSQSAQDTLAGMGIAFSVVAAGILIRYVKHVETLVPQFVLLVSLFTVTIIPFLLPHMHERYFFLADILSVMYAFVYPQRWYIPIFVVLASFFSYLHYLSQYVPLFQPFLLDERYMATLMALALATMYLAIKENLRASAEVKNRGIRSPYAVADIEMSSSIR